MSASALVRYALPALLTGSVGGYFVGQTLAVQSANAGKKEGSLRARFLDTEDDPVDYDKLARVCMRARGEVSPIQVKGAPSASSASDEQLDPEEVQQTIGRLDEVMAASIDQGEWTRGAGLAARTMLRKIPPSDAADFESLLRASVEQGELRVQPGAWVPTRLN